MNSQRPGVQVAHPAVSTYLMMEEIKRLLVAPKRTKLPYSFQASLTGPSERQTSWDDLSHVYYQMAKHRMLQSAVGKRKNLNSSFDTLAVANHPFRRGHSECSYSRDMVAEDRRRSFPLAPHATSIAKYCQSQMLMELNKAEVEATRKLCRNMKETQVALEQLEDTRQPQEPKVLVQAEKSFLGCLMRKHNQHKKNQQKLRRGHVQECGEIGRRMQMVGLQYQHNKNQIDAEDSPQTLIGQMVSSEQEVMPRVLMGETKPKSALGKIQSWELSSGKGSESKISPAINRENQKLWKELEHLAQDYYRVENTRKQMLKQKEELRNQRWDSVIHGTSIRLAWRDHKQRCPSDPEMLKSSVSSPLHPTMRINLN